jgi:putative nucleotidyltransferase with HDIG domain
MLNTINQQNEVIRIAAPPENSITKILKANLPPLPGSVFRILELLRDVNVTNAALATAVGYDPLLAARLLRLANSTYYSRQNNVTTISRAIDTIGTKALYDAVMLGVAANTFSKEIENSAIGRAIWEHSLAVAILARKLTDVLQMRGAENAFICGLLHDIGKLILLKSDPEGYRSISEGNDDDEMMKAEDEYFGVNHAEVGALLIKRWNLPEAISSVVLYHHEPAKTNQAIFTAHVISVADLIADKYGYGVSPMKEDDYSDDEEISMLQSESIIALRLTQSQMFDAWESVQPNLQDIVKTFRGK